MHTVLGQDRGASLLGLRPVARRHHDERALARELSRDLEPEPAVRPGHDGGLARQIRDVRRGPVHGPIVGRGRAIHPSLRVAKADHRSANHPMEAPTAGDALQLVLTGVIEPQARTRDEVLHGL
jgi:hypothetical protein